MRWHLFPFAPRSSASWLSEQFRAFMWTQGMHGQLTFVGCTMPGPGSPCHLRQGDAYLSDLVRSTLTADADGKNELTAARTAMHGGDRRAPSRVRFHRMPG